MWTTLNAWWAPGSNEPVNDAQSVSALPERCAVLEAWREWRSIQAAEPLASASGRAVNQWEKQLFFAKKDFQQALESVDVVAFMDRLDAIQEASSDTSMEELAAVEEAQPRQMQPASPWSWERLKRTCPMPFSVNRIGMGCLKKAERWQRMAVKHAQKPMERRSRVPRLRLSLCETLRPQAGREL